MGFPKQEYWSGFPSPGDLAKPGIQPMSLMSPALSGGFLPLSHKLKRSIQIQKRGSLGRAATFCSGKSTRVNLRHRLCGLQNETSGHPGKPDRWRAGLRQREYRGRIGFSKGPLLWHASVGQSLWLNQGKSLLQLKIFVYVFTQD